MYNLHADLPHIAEALLGHPWMILPDVHRSLVQQIIDHRSGTGAAYLQQLALAQQAAAAAPKKSPTAQADLPPGYVNRITTFDATSRIALMEVSGVMGKGLGPLATLCGGVDMNAVHDGMDRLRELKPAAVQLYLNTPGGSVLGTQEAADVIEEFAREVAPVHAYVDAQCASAGAWLGSAATSLTAAPTATLGSIGVYSALIDKSAAYADAGIKVQLITSGPLKGGHEALSPTPAQIAEAQRKVDEMAALFFDQMRRRQPASRAALDPAVHFTGGHWQAQSAAGSALHDGLVRDRTAHIRALIAEYSPRKKPAH